jgi:hypothetical protein
MKKQAKRSERKVGDEKAPDLGAYIQRTLQLLARLEPRVRRAVLRACIEANEVSVPFSLFR